MLIIFGKGITATLSIEMVMLFLRSGFSVYPVLADGAEDWIAPETLKQITGRAPLSSKFSPAWQQKKHDFSLALLVNPDDLVVKSIHSGNELDGIFKYVEDNCNRFFIALGDNSANSVSSMTLSSLLSSPSDKRIMTFKLPQAIEHIAKAMDTLFAEVMRFLVFRSKLDNFTFKILLDLQDYSSKAFEDYENWLEKLNNEFVKRSLTAVDENQVDLIVENIGVANVNVGNSDDLLDDVTTCSNPDNLKHSKALLRLKLASSELSDDEIVPLVKKNLVVFKFINFGSIQIYDVTGTRLFPDLTGQTSIGRLADYIIDRLQVLSTNDKLYE